MDKTRFIKLLLRGLIKWGAIGMLLTVAGWWLLLFFDPYFPADGKDYIEGLVLGAILGAAIGAGANIVFRFLRWVFTD